MEFLKLIPAMVVFTCLLTVLSLTVSGEDALSTFIIIGCIVFIGAVAHIVIKDERR